MHQNEEINVQLAAKLKNGLEKGASPFKAYLTDLYANINMESEYA